MTDFSWHGFITPLPWDVLQLNHDTEHSSQEYWDRQCRQRKQCEQGYGSVPHLVHFDVTVECHAVTERGVNPSIS